MPSAMSIQQIQRTSTSLLPEQFDSVFEQPANNPLLIGLLDAVLDISQNDNRTQLNHDAFRKRRMPCIHIGFQAPPKLIMRLYDSLTTPACRFVND
jgi:hypothetical protein